MPWIKTTVFSVTSHSLFISRGITTMLQKIRQFLVSEDGPTAVEYAVMLALIVIVCLTAIQSLGTQANTTFNNVAGSLGGGGS